jgi:CheY-like chemotaxis protein
MSFKNQQGSAPRALVIEDIKVDSMVILRMLQKLNCEVTVARNGKEAVDLFLQGKMFDIVFCDQDMPVMTGPEVLHLLSVYKCFLLNLLINLTKQEK